MGADDTSCCRTRRAGRTSTPWSTIPATGTRTIQGWFEDTGVWYFRSRDEPPGHRARGRHHAAQSVNELLYEDDQVTIYRLNGAPPALPILLLLRDRTRNFSPTWSPGRLAVAYNNNGASPAARHPRGRRAPARLHAARRGASVVIEGAAPTGGPPTSRSARRPRLRRPCWPGDADRARGPAPRPAATARRGRRSACGACARLRAALAAGLTVRATGVRGRRVRLVARRGRTIVARGAARTDARGRSDDPPALHRGRAAVAARHAPGLARGHRRRACPDRRPLALKRASPWSRRAAPPAAARSRRRGVDPPR